MRKAIQTAISAVVFIVGAVWWWPLKALEVVEHVMTAVHLGGYYDDVRMWVEHHPDPVGEVGPWVLMFGGLLSLGTIHVWPRLGSWIAPVKASDIKLSIEPNFSLELADPPAPPMMTRCVWLKNVGDHHLQHCHVKLSAEPISAAHKLSIRRSHMVSPSFDLLPGEEKAVPIIRIPLRESRDEYARVYIFRNSGRELVRDTKSVWLLSPEDHAVLVEAYASNTQPSRLRLLVAHSGGDWDITESDSTS